jgi:glycerate 2-kinase
VPDERSVAAGTAALALMAEAGEDDRVIVAISGGASALLEQPRIPLADFIRVTSAVMAAGAPIRELNVVRSALSAIKGGQLALASKAPVITLAASDVIGDRLDVIGSGPTIGPWLAGAGRIVDVGAGAEERRREAVELLEQYRIAVPAILREPIGSRGVMRDGDRAEIVIPLGEVAKAARRELGAWGVSARGLDFVIQGDIAELAGKLAKRAETGLVVGYGEPTLAIPAEHGEGGRAQQLALELARHFRGTAHAALVAGTDGKDGPAPRARPSPAGAFVDSTTWDRIVATGRDPEAALARRDAGTVLDAIDALIVTGPTGINHADLVIVG